MLKLEKTARDHELNLIVNDKEHFLTSSLLIAFAIATIIHILLFLIFQITPLALRLNERIYPPIIVQVDPLINTAAAVVANTSPAAQTKDHLPYLPPIRPIVSEIPAFITVRHLDEIKQNHQEINPFSHIEKDIYAVSLLPTKPASSKPNLETVISGPLASLLLVTPPLSIEPVTFAKGETQYRVIFSVVVDKVSGKVVWYMLKESTTDSQIDKLAEKIMLAMQFARNTTGFTSDGEIEFHFHKHEANES